MMRALLLGLVILHPAACVSITKPAGAESQGAAMKVITKYVYEQRSLLHFAKEEYKSTQQDCNDELSSINNDMSDTTSAIESLSFSIDAYDNKIAELKSEIHQQTKKLEHTQADQKNRHEKWSGKNVDMATKLTQLGEAISTVKAASSAIGDDEHESSGTVKGLVDNLGKELKSQKGALAQAKTEAKESMDATTESNAATSKGCNKAINAAEKAKAKFAAVKGGMVAELNNQKKMQEELLAANGKMTTNCFLAKKSFDKAANDLENNIESAKAGGEKMAADNAALTFDPDARGADCAAYDGPVKAGYETMTGVQWCASWNCAEADCTRPKFCEDQGLTCKEGYKVSNGLRGTNERECCEPKTCGDVEGKDALCKAKDGEVFTSNNDALGTDKDACCVRADCARAAEKRGASSCSKFAHNQSLRRLPGGSLNFGDANDEEFDHMCPCPMDGGVQLVQKKNHFEHPAVKSALLSVSAHAGLAAKAMAEMKSDPFKFIKDQINTMINTLAKENQKEMDMHGKCEAALKQAHSRMAGAWGRVNDLAAESTRNLNIQEASWREFVAARGRDKDARKRNEKAQAKLDKTTADHIARLEQLHLTEEEMHSALIAVKGLAGESQAVISGILKSMLNTVRKDISDSSAEFDDFKNIQLEMIAFTRNKLADNIQKQSTMRNRFKTAQADRNAADAANKETNKVILTTENWLMGLRPVCFKRGLSREDQIKNLKTETAALCEAANALVEGSMSC